MDENKLVESNAHSAPTGLSEGERGRVVTRVANGVGSCSCALGNSYCGISLGA